MLLVREEICWDIDFITLKELGKLLKKKVDSVEIGTDYKRQSGKDYLTQEQGNSKYSSITTKMTASKHPCKVSHQQKPLTIPCGRRQETKRGQTELHHLGHHKELGQEATSKSTRFS
jgi:hypothetical protein